MIRYAERSIARGSGKAVAVEVKLHGEAGAADLLEQGIETVETRLGGQLEILALLRASPRAAGASR